METSPLLGCWTFQIFGCRYPAVELPAVLSSYSTVLRISSCPSGSSSLLSGSSSVVGRTFPARSSKRNASYSCQSVNRPSWLGPTAAAYTRRQCSSAVCVSCRRCRCWRSSGRSSARNSAPVLRSRASVVLGSRPGQIQRAKKKRSCVAIKYKI